MRTAAPCSITARRRSSVPSTRPAANSTASSVNPSAEPSSYPQIPRTRLFFKALKQNLKVKSFVGTSRNALLIQIWTALNAMLLLKWLHHLSQAKWSFSNLASMLRLNLFTYRDLRRWLENPFGTPPLVPLAEQLSLDLS